jgi:hypothetical protein
LSGGLKSAEGQFAQGSVCLTLNQRRRIFRARDGCKVLQSAGGSTVLTHEKLVHRHHPQAAKMIFRIADVDRDCQRALHGMQESSPLRTPDYL